MMIDQTQTEAPFGATVTPMEEAVPFPEILTVSEVDALKIDLESAQTVNAGLRNSNNELRSKQVKLYEALNEAISEGDCSESDEISFGDLSLIIKQVFGEDLTFLKKFEVELEWTVRATVSIKAKSAEDARYIADDISFDDPDLDIDDDTTEIDSIDIDAEGVRSCHQQYR